MTYVLLELVHADLVNLFETREDANAALSRIVSAHPEAADEFGVFELDERGFPIDPPQDEDAGARASAPPRHE
jgi:hypothetical protein